ncbi:Heparinase II/III N-terminus [Porphyromonadaceae bacterium KH3CP3RA]|nr:Heparinase II/III N-terminus [Porphyromonadaceae bacterium KH3CP3RA]
MGARYTIYRVRHEWEMRTGILKKRHPANPPARRFISLEEWRDNTPLFVIPEREKLRLKKRPDRKLKEKTARILQGEIPFFSSEWKKIGEDHDWVTNPDNGYRYDITKHWSEIPDFSKESGDIKYVWEKSRFTHLLTIIRNDYHHDEDHSGFVFSEIEDWIDANPVNQGPNWRCSQETSLRIFNWCFALHFYKNSSALTEERWNKIQNVMYWSLHHVYHHIDFSRIAVRNNHAITETLFLALSEVLFPYIPETKKWAKDGRKWFEEEIDYQIYNDGTFLQFSMNYHRVVIQLLSLGISVTKINGKPFSDIVYEKAYKSLNFLYQCLQEENGFLPNYGANDGAWFFPLSDTDYRDFRPQLNTLHTLLTGHPLYEDEHLAQDTRWMGADKVSIHNPYPVLSKKYGTMEFGAGGYYLIREQDSFTFIKCGSYKDRPSHADNLHIDIWYKGENILCDGGSYKYNTDLKTVKYFSGTESHNTVMLDDYDQMLKGPRFIWLNWSQADNVSFIETETEFVFVGTVHCFTYLNKKIVHQRKISKIKNRPQWIIHDRIIHKPVNLQMRQIWHSPPDCEISFSSANSEKFIKNGERSLYYGLKEKVPQTEFLTSGDEIKTTITIE